ncbi:hypothetical protein ACIODS_12455 [Micromonospora chalcea]|uniref:hypothetical protein n=1 Tax=Micromonospora chalcea TaxID=1874 RepID=UPI003803F682
MTLDIDAARKLADTATEGPWAYNSYSAVFSTPKIKPHDDWLGTIGEHTLERRGECAACGSGSTGCALYSEDYTREALVAHVPAHHGDTATGQRVADAEFIAAARALVPQLCDEIERGVDTIRDLRVRLEYLTEAATEAARWASIRPGEAGQALEALCDAVSRTAVVEGGSRSWSLPAEPNVDRLRDRHNRLWVRARYTNGPDLWWQGEPGNGLPCLWMELLSDGPLTDASNEQVAA